MEYLAQGPYLSMVLLKKCLFKIRCYGVWRVSYGSDLIVILRAPYDLAPSSFSDTQPEMPKSRGQCNGLNPQKRFVVYCTQ